MKGYRNGFTLVEISLFLAITAVIFVGIVAGTQNSVYQQRYNDAVQSFVDFLKNNYSQVMNVQSDGEGNSNHEIYGRMIVFREDEITSYSVIGEIREDLSGGDMLHQISRKTGANPKEGAKVGVYDGEEAGLTETYVPKWGSAIQIKDGDSFAQFKGAIMIVRHPETGSVYTYWTNTEGIEKGDEIPEDTPEARSWDFELEQLDLCVNPNGNTADSDFRRDVRIERNARSASGVTLVPDNLECK